MDARVDISTMARNADTLPTGEVISLAAIHETRHPADSLPVRDSLLSQPDSLILRQDSIVAAENNFFHTGGIAYRSVESEAIFGTESVSAEYPTPGSTTSQILIEDPFFHGFVLLLAAIYTLQICNNLSDARLLLARVLKDSASNKGRVFDDQGSISYSRFLNATWAIGLLFVGVAAVKYAENVLPTSLIAELPRGAALGISLAATFVCLGVVLYQFTALRLAGALTLTQHFIMQLAYLKRTYFALAVWVVVPVGLLFFLCPKDTGQGWLYFIIAETLIISILFLKESLILFISKKISIMHWFLYLCAIECFPISLVWLILVRA